MTSAYTLEEAREYLELWKKCKKVLASGTAKSYRIGTREFTAFDLDEVDRQIDKYATIVGQLSGTIRRSRVQRVVPRDL